MKKFLIALLVCVAVMSLAAYAELPTYTPESDGTYTIGYTEGAESNYYALLVVEGVYAEGETPVISEDTVLYIDQATANANGDVSFDGWIPKNEEPATVYLGGSNFTDGPVLLGYLGSNTFLITGTIDSDSYYEATVTLTDANGGVYTATSVSGAYAVEVPEGTYTFTVNVKNHLSYTKKALTVEADTTFKTVELLAGDTDGDGKIISLDLDTVLSKFNTSDESADVDGSGKVNALDLDTVLSNFNEESVVED